MLFFVLLDAGHKGLPGDRDLDFRCIWESDVLKF